MFSKVHTSLSETVSVVVAPMWSWFTSENERERGDDTGSSGLSVATAMVGATLGLLLHADHQPCCCCCCWVSNKVS